MLLLAQRVEQLGRGGLEWGSAILDPVEAQYVVAEAGVRDLTSMIKTADNASSALTARAAGVLDRSVELEAELRSARVREVEADARERLAAHRGQLAVTGS